MSNKQDDEIPDNIDFSHAVRGKYSARALLRAVDASTDLYGALERLLAAIDGHLGQVAVEEALQDARRTLRRWGPNER